MDKTTFIEEIKKCFTLLQENHVIKKAVEDLYNKVHNTLVSNEQINLGNDYYIRSTEDSLYIYKNEIRLLKLDVQYYEEDEFYYFNLYLGEAPAVLHISVSNEDGLNIYYDTGNIQNSISLTDVFTINSELYVHGISHFFNEVFFNAHPLWFNINGHQVDMSKGPQYSSTGNRKYLVTGDIVNETVFNNMQVTKKFYTDYQGDTTYYYLFQDNGYFREQVWVGFTRGEQDIGIQFVIISKDTREIQLGSYPFQF